ncbi:MULTISPECIES: hypothetical protein [unclassified Pseudomonas]|uniref:hypothetical protein n=1 Tax=unclassified Pseudomonas TaxID=196821 RepID=UPI000A1E0C73|nr:MULTISPECIES: hypothetical protein [unclassified Pseudomonas]
MNLTYQDPSISHDEATRLLATGEDRNIIAGLISIGLNELDRVWAQNACLAYLTSESEAVAASAVTALGHLARRHCETDRETVIPALEAVKVKFPTLDGIVTDALDDIDAYT